MTRWRVLRWSVAALFVVLFGACLACAHALGVSRGEYRATALGLEVDIVFAQHELASALGEVDARSSSRILADVAVSAGSARCTPELVETESTERDGLRVRARYTCPHSGELHVVWNVLDRLSHGHRHVARVADGGEHVLFASQRAFDVERAGTTAGAREPASSAGDWIALGVHHIVTGYDHLVFLLALVLVAKDLFALVRVVSCFTVAHSLTLAAAALGLVAPPESLVEPAIALSIAYVGLENLVAGRWKTRPLLVFAFGLVHGFGFAGVLSAIDVPRDELPFALFLFNLGVELGQLALIAAVFPLVRSIARRPWFAPRLVPACSALIVALGLGWFVARITG